MPSRKKRKILTCLGPQVAYPFPETAGFPSSSTVPTILKRKKLNNPSERKPIGRAASSISKHFPTAEAEATNTTRSALGDPLI